ncbi:MULTISPECIES: V-type ATP synthase subunit I [unclassified Oceanispirochaeta]|uniref:V-type ATP synthase subunit I n=1 Tax=unclassified Oceanispirochaeta TaxID=2635722 RepID=UPI000E098429|nr:MULTISPECIES: V-type ATPase 116kDa subunit family protein [unclassified Oceanispirochaeta]MBF9015880.1 ATPase V [Oceanispirochaeta sp. M2]NPD72343.1 ATPase V [Oceanispirochaeta sp. M1]RDG32113.1 ATPase V [Oceanispirochaeta sp. M1]
MILSSKMNHLTAVVTRAHMDSVTTVLLQMGVMDFIKTEEIPFLRDQRLQSLEVNESAARMAESRLRIETLLRSADLLPVMGDEIEASSNDSLDKIEKMLDALSNEQQGFRDKQQEIQSEINRLLDMKRQVDLFGDEKALIERAEKGVSGYSFLFLETGSVESKMLQGLQDSLSSLTTVVIETVSQNKRSHCIIMGMKKDQSEIQKRLESASWIKGPLPPEAAASLNSDKANNRASGDVDIRVGALKKSQDEIKEKSREYIRGKIEWLQSTWSDLHIRELYLKIQSYFSSSESCILFNGWVPEEHREELDKRVKEAAEGHCLLDWHDTVWVDKTTEGRLTPPVEMKNPRAFRPFEMLVKNFGTPAYGTIDPTPLVAVSYLAMFGLMFGDAGHGLILILAGLGMIIKDRKQGKEPKNLYTLIIYCGGAAVAAGVLFGSYFGYSWFPPLWFNYHAVVAGHSSGHEAINNIYDILLITIWFGIAVLGLGIVLNIINCIRKKDWVRLIFNKAGILGAWMYAAGVYTAFVFVENAYKTLPSSTVLTLGLGLPALLLLFKEPVEHILEGHHFSLKPSSLMNLFMEWMVELLEIFSGYLANTLSFMRVAGLGIAHVSLMTAFFQMADMAPPAGGVLILLLGNALVIALEGLSAGIQSLRLNYYEFFSKYFNGTGRAYEPISLKSRLGGSSES